MSDDQNEYRPMVVPEAKAHWSDFAPALALLSVGIAGLAVATVMATAVQGQFLVVGPGLDPARLMDVVYRAGGGVVGLGGVPGVAIAASDDPGFRAAVLSQGAWFVMASPRLLGCFAATTGLRG
ncbi:MAG: hypothetical protein L0G27_01610 [Paracoccus sp. (in: a-proteobacteria)]|nr:hypothetical protein [Paracoccus sp. (in: a-proteobacteria)]